VLCLHKYPESIQEHPINENCFFGARGNTGLEIVKQALEEGHSVTAFVRDPARMPNKDNHLAAATGDVLDPAAVDQAVKGQDAVVSALGAGNDLKKTVCAQQAQSTSSTARRNIKLIVWWWYSQWALARAGIPHPGPLSQTQLQISLLQETQLRSSNNLK